MLRIDDNSVKNNGFGAPFDCKQVWTVAKAAGSKRTTTWVYVYRVGLTGGGAKVWDCPV